MKRGTYLFILFQKYVRYVIHVCFNTSINVFTKSQLLLKNMCIMQNSKFEDLWHQFCPKAVVAKPMTDQHLTCQENTTKLAWVTNLPEHKKADCTNTEQKYFHCAQVERVLQENLLRCTHDFQSNRLTTGCCFCYFYWDVLCNDYKFWGLGEGDWESQKHLNLCRLRSSTL